jgi:hypothetical protein
MRETPIIHSYGRTSIGIKYLGFVNVCQQAWRFELLQWPGSPTHLNTVSMLSAAFLCIQMMASMVNKCTHPDVRNLALASPKRR